MSAHLFQWDDHDRHVGVVFKPPCEPTDDDVMQGVVVGSADHDEIRVSASREPSQLVRGIAPLDVQRGGNAEGA